MSKHISLNKLSEIVKQSCAVQNIAQEQLCELTGISRNTIRRIEQKGVYSKHFTIGKIS